MKRLQTLLTRALAGTLVAAMAATYMPVLPTMVAHAEETGTLAKVTDAKADGNVVTVTFNDGITGKITFLEEDIFRYNVDPSGEFSEYGTTNNGSDTAKIPQYPDSSDEYSHPNAAVKEENGDYVITSGKTEIRFDGDTAMMTVSYGGKVVMEESKSLTLGNTTVQTLVQNGDENYYGGGTQNGRFVHTGQVINIANESIWVDGGVASPNPFYYSTAGYGVLRNTFKPGSYDFGSTASGTVTASHNENEYDAYIFLSDGANSAQVVQDILADYYHVTGNPVLLPEYAFYEGHLNCYNRDSWVDTQVSGGTPNWIIRGSASASGTDDTVSIASSYKESGMATGYVLPEGSNAESLNGQKVSPTVALDNYPTVNLEDKFSARAVIDQYGEYDMPLGYFLPNDGYGCGYGQNGYYMTGGVEEDGSSSAQRTAAIDANVANLKAFTQYAQSKGVETGLWTQSNLTPDSNSGTAWHLLRDFKKEVKVGGITTLKTDVAWVGQGYNFAFNGLKTAYDIVTGDVSYRPNIITLDGWAGTQRYGAIWTGDQTGGNWEYIRFHVPTYIGQSLSGNPNIGSDMDGIFGGNPIVSVRDTQWKTFTPLMLNMDGWGSYAKTPQTFGDPYTGISRMYLKLKAQLMPYLYTGAASAANIDTGNDDTGMPMIRAMFLEYPEDSYANTKAMQYQFMYGPSILVAPVYSENSMDDVGNDVRNDIYLPDEDQIWIDYFTGEQYYGGQTLNGFEAPIWKLPVFVKNGAIIPMWEENNSPSLVDRTQRLVEFWPAGSTEYTLYEDDGKTANAKIEEVEGYGTTNTVTYGDHVSTTFTSTVTNGTAVLTAEKSTGTYEGYDQNKDTTFIVNVSEEPTAVTAQNGSTRLTMVEANSKEEVLNADVAEGTFVYFYDGAPAIEGYTVDAEDEFTAMMAGQTSSPKLYVKFASTDTQTNAQTLTLVGFENVDPNLAANELNPNLAAPTGLADVEAEKTPTSNTLTWDKVEDATGYQMEIDDIVNAVGSETTFVHGNQAYNSTHTYRVRAVNDDGYSEWSDPVKATTALDPWRNVPTPVEVTWTGGDQWGALSNAFDHNYGNMFHSTGDVVTDAVPMILDYGKAYKLDKLVYVARTDNYGNGAVQQLDVYTSLDGVNWTLQWDGSENEAWSYDDSKSVEENFKTVPLTGAARYVKLVVTQSKGGFFSAAELSLYKLDGSTPFAVGSTTYALEVGGGDLTNLQNYKGSSKDDPDNFNQIANNYGDINGNGIYEVYDYAYTMFNLDGGTKQTGAVSGNILLLPSADTVNTGETFTVDVYASDVSNLNAFGGVYYFDQAQLEAVSVTGTTKVAQMTDLSISKTYKDVDGYVNLAFANRGDKPLFSGSGILATITMRAKTDNVTVADAMNLSSVTLIGPAFDTIVCENMDSPKPPVIVGGEESAYTYPTDFTVTMTNSQLPTDGGGNVNKLIQQNSYDGLFNGGMGRDFEFKWDIESNYVSTGKLPAYVSVPLTIRTDLTSSAFVEHVKLYNSYQGSNGYVTSAWAVYYYDDDTNAPVDSITASGDGFVFDFVNPKPAKDVKAVEVILEACSPANNVLTLSEMQLCGAEDAILNYGTDFTVTMTNSHLPTDDGGNVNKLIQQNSYDGLFNGNTDASDRSFEFKYESLAENQEKVFPPEVSLPLTMHLNMTEAKAVDTVKLYNANLGNGFLTKASAVFHYADSTEGTVPTITGDKEANYAFQFENPDDTGKLVTSVDLVLEEAINYDGEEVSNMLTLSELQVLYTSSVVEVEGISAAADNVKEMYIGTMVDINAEFTPDNATNPYFTAESSNPSAVKIITMKDENGLPIYKAYAVAAGTAQITLKAVEDESITASYTITVKAGADKTELEKALQELGNANSDFYTPESYNAYKKALDDAYAVMKNEKADAEEVAEAVAALREAYGKLTETTVPQLSNEDFTADALYSDSNVAANLFDNDLSTFWESPYTGDDAQLPQEVVVNLGKVLTLDKVELVSHTAQNGGVAAFEVWTRNVNSETEEWNLVGEYTVDRDLYTQGRNVIAGARFAAVQTDSIKIVITEAVGRIPAEDDMYARIAELRVYGDQRIEETLTEALTTLAQEKLDQNKYTPETWQAYAQQLANAQAVLADPNSTEADYSAAIAALENARGALAGKPSGKPSHSDDDDDDHSSGSAPSTNTGAAAQPTATPEPARPAQTSQYTRPTQTGDGNTSQVVDKSALKSLAESVEKRNQSDYTETSWAKFAQALENAKEVLDDITVTQSDVNKAMKELEEATAALMTPEQEVEAGLEPTPEVEAPVEEKTETGSILPIILLGVGAVIVIAGIVFLKSRREE